MNANELAKWVEDENVVDIMFTPQEHYRGLVATMLRQQQSEIEALKKQVELLSNAFETVCDGMETSLELNKAQAERYWSEKK